MDGAWVPTMLKDAAANAITLRLTDVIDIRIPNLIVETESIVNDFDGTVYNQNVIDYVGHRPVEVSLTAIFIKSTDYERLHFWMKNNTKLLFYDTSNRVLSIGNSVCEYRPEAWRVVSLKETLTAGEPVITTYNIILREVPPG
jgi:hypothetical protein